jgi:hypothetical protein
MATTCDYCLGSVEIFGQTLLRDACPFCGRPLYGEPADPGAGDDGFGRVRFASVIVGAVISKGLLRFDWLYITLMIPLGFMLLFAAQELADWIRHRHDPPGLSLK